MDMAAAAVQQGFAAQDAVQIGAPIWRGWGKFISIVRSIGVPHYGAEEALFPVTYREGDQAIIRVTTRMRWNGHEQYAYEELRPRSDELRMLLEHSAGIPEVIRVMEHCYVIGINDEQDDLLLYLQRGKEKLINERVEPLGS